MDKGQKKEKDIFFLALKRRDIEAASFDRCQNVILLKILLILFPFFVVKMWFKEREFVSFHRERLVKEEEEKEEEEEEEEEEESVP